MGAGLKILQEGDWPGVQQEKNRREKCIASEFNFQDFSASVSQIGTEDSQL